MILTVHDAPVTSGIGVTSFEVTLTGAVLQPGNVALVSAPGQTIELTQLLTNSVAFPVVTVGATSYTSLVLTIANPQITILNDTGVSFPLGNGQNCLNGASCILTPTITNGSTITVPVTVTPSATEGTMLEVDVNLNDIIEQAQRGLGIDFTQAGALSVAVTQHPQLTATLGDFSVHGQVTSVNAGNDQFTITASTGQSFTIGVDTSGASATAFEFLRDSCAANNFSCLAVGQIVNVDAAILGSGSYTAVEVDFDQAPATQLVSGTIVSLANINNANPSLQLVVHNTVPANATLTTGSPVTVNFANTLTLEINNGQFGLPPGATFGSFSDFLVGQEVEVDIVNGAVTTNPLAFTADTLALEKTQLLATVTSTNSLTNLFTIGSQADPLPAIYSDNPLQTILQMQVNNTSGTLYQNLSPDNLSGLQVNQQVSVGGFLFNTIGTVGSPTIQAVIVRGP
ncbi:MAG: DUF5666 domain-containing protein [Candidatus Acidiferrales bacterium]